MLKNFIKIHERSSLLQRGSITALLNRKYSNEASSILQIKDENLHGNVRRIILSNDKQRNTLSLEAIKLLQKAIKETDVEKFRAIIITAEQRNVFSSGHNLKELACDKVSEKQELIFKECQTLCNMLVNSPLPTIAEVYGLAAAAGFQLALSCDLLIASDKASFSTPGVKFGIFCSTPGVALARNLPPKLSMKMLLTGEPISAQEAFKYGLVTEIVSADKLTERVNQIVHLINHNSRPIIALGKKCFYKQIEKTDLNEAYDYASAVMVDNLKYEDTQNGLKSFAAKKKPVWSHSSKKLE